jgi:hypothetical protein
VSDRLAAARAYVTNKPSDRFGLYALAMELRKTGAWAFETLSTHHPNYGPAWYHHGMARKESGDREGARTTWEAGLAACRATDAHTAAEIEEALEQLADE